MSYSLSTTVKAFAVASFALVAMLWLGNFLDSYRPEPKESYIDEDLTLQAARLKGSAFGMEGLIADWYWIRSLQYTGGKITRKGDKHINIDDLSEINPRLLYPLLDSATSLDPKLDAAFYYGAIVLPAVNPKQAIAIAEKAIKHNPENWRYYQQIGYIYWKMHNYTEASKYYLEGAKLNGAPAYLAMMAAKMKNEGGSRETAREMYSQMLNSSHDENTRGSIKRRIYELDAQEQMEIVQKVLDNIKDKTGRCPATFSEILQPLATEAAKNSVDLAVSKTRILVDPTGTPYLLDRTECKIKVDRENSFLPK
ncbi:MAG: tetratricopeptide repeat protein [Pyrinomonadaceae bacterium]